MLCCRRTLSNWEFKDLDGSKAADFNVIQFYQMNYIFEVEQSRWQNFK